MVYIDYQIKNLTVKCLMQYSCTNKKYDPYLKKSMSSKLKILLTQNM